MSEMIDKGLKNTPSKHNDSTQMESTVSGNLTAKIVQLSLKELRSRDNLNHFLGDALPKNDIGFSECSNDLYKEEDEGDFYMRPEKISREINKMVEHFVSEEVAKKRCSALQTDLKEFLVLLGSSQEGTFSSQDKLFFGKLNIKKCLKRKNSAENRRTFGKNIKSEIYLAKRVLKEHGHLSNGDKTRTKSVYKKLQEYMGELISLKNQPDEKQSFQFKESFTSKKHSHHGVKTTTEGTAIYPSSFYWYPATVDYNVPSQNKPVESYWHPSVNPEPASEGAPEYEYTPGDQNKDRYVEVPEDVNGVRDPQLSADVQRLLEKYGLHPKKTDGNGVQNSYNDAVK